MPPRSYRARPASRLRKHGTWTTSGGRRWKRWTTSRPLIAADNFRGHGLDGFGATLGDLALARVYLKRHEDYAQARAICEERLGELPTIYAVGDICRPELLVEIEGMAFSRRQG